MIDRNAFTIKPADRSLLFDVRVLAVGGPSDDAGFAGVNTFAMKTTGVNPGERVEAAESFGVVNDASGDGGASSATLPGRSTYRFAER